MLMFSCKILDNNANQHKNNIVAREWAGENAPAEGIKRNGEG